MKPATLLLMAYFSCCHFNSTSAQRVLIVIAHPDDEGGCTATAYKIAHERKGVVDLALITNGEGGYKYSTLAEDYYHLELTDEKTGRENLPRIRKQELMNAGRIIGIRNYYFLDQQDNKYSTDEKDPLGAAWDTAFVKGRLEQIMTKEKYDFVFCLLPVPETHGHHKAATLLALEAASRLEKELRPVVLGFSTSEKKDTTRRMFTQLKDYSLTEIDKNAPVFQLDRTTKFGFKNTLDYKIVVNWAIAEHKSQGTVQVLMNEGDNENFWYFKMNEAAGIEKLKSLFEDLKKIPYPVKSY